MDKNELAQYRALQTELKLIDKALPNASGSSKRRLSERRARVKTEIIKINRFIGNIGDSLTRQIITERYINGKTWQEVASSVGGNSEDSVRKIAERYLTEKR